MLPGGEIVDRGDWRSIVIHGNATRIIDPVERERILKLILESNPTLMPAMGIRWTNDWIRENKEVVYRIDPTEKSGRYAQKVDVAVAGAQPMLSH